MYKLCKTEQSATRQRQLEEGLLTAMKMKRYEEITISDLCDQMQIPRKSFYRYFSSKDGALQALIDHRLEAFEREIDLRTTGLTDVRHQCREFFSFWYQEKEFLDALSRSELSGFLVQRAIRRARDEGECPVELAAEPCPARDHAITFSVCGIMALVIRWHRLGFLESVDEMADIAVRVLTVPII